MKMVMKGRYYNTDEDELIWKVTGGAGPEALNYYEECLYRGRNTGEYYLYRYGGPDAPAGKGGGWYEHQGTWYGDIHQFQLTEEQVEAWKKKNGYYQTSPWYEQIKPI